MEKGEAAASPSLISILPTKGDPFYCTAALPHTSAVHFAVAVKPQPSVPTRYKLFCATLSHGMGQGGEGAACSGRHLVAPKAQSRRYRARPLGGGRCLPPTRSQAPIPFLFSVEKTLAALSPLPIKEGKRFPRIFRMKRGTPAYDGPSCNLGREQFIGDYI